MTSQHIEPCSDNSDDRMRIGQGCGSTNPKCVQSENDDNQQD